MRGFAMIVSMSRSIDWEICCTNMCYGCDVLGCVRPLSWRRKALGFKALAMKNHDIA